MSSRGGNLSSCGVSSSHSRLSSTPVHLCYRFSLSPFIMSKRGASSDIPMRPIKLCKGENVWNTIDDSDGKDKVFKPVEGGPKTRILKSLVLNYKPRMDVFISLNGFQPEVRFTGADGSFTMTGQEFLDFSDSRAVAKPSDCVRLEPTEEDGFRLARYEQTTSGLCELFPREIFDVSKYAAKRLKSKLPVICDHVCALRDSEDVIRVMFDCVVTSYESEYTLLNSHRPIHDIFPELSRIVEIYVPSVSIVRMFLDKLQDKKLVSKFNHYNLLAIVLSQKMELYGLCL